MRTNSAPMIVSSRRLLHGKQLESVGKRAGEVLGAVRAATVAKEGVHEDAAEGLVQPH